MGWKCRRLFKYFMTKSGENFQIKYLNFSSMAATSTFDSAFDRFGRRKIFLKKHLNKGTRRFIKTYCLICESALFQ